MFIFKEKYPKKVLFWIAICSKGLSEPFFYKGTINQKGYKKECIQKRLIPFLIKHYPDDKYIFWPDLASSHYANTVQDFMNDNNINFLAKESNPPNAPQLRPIEKFWKNLKEKVMAKNYNPSNIEQLKKKIRIS